MLIIVELIRVDVEYILLSSFLCIMEKSYRKTYLAISNLDWYKLEIGTSLKSDQCYRKKTQSVITSAHNIYIVSHVCE